MRELPRVLVFLAMERFSNCWKHSNMIGRLSPRTGLRRSRCALSKSVAEPWRWVARVEGLVIHENRSICHVTSIQFEEAIAYGHICAPGSSRHLWVLRRRQFCRHFSNEYDKADAIGHLLGSAGSGTDCSTSARGRSASSVLCGWNLWKLVIGYESKYRRDGSISWRD